MILFINCSHTKEIRTKNISNTIYNMQIRSLRKQTFTINEIANGKPMLIAFFTTYCVPFLDYIEFLNKINERFEANGMAKIVGISMDIQPYTMLEPFIEEFGIKFLVVVGNDDLINSGITPAGKIYDIPKFWIVDTNGHIVWQGSGSGLKKEIFSRLNELVNPEYKEFQQ